jgi:hypothetical protein
MTTRKFRIIVGLVALACVLGVYVAAVADTLATNEKTAVYRFNCTYVTAGGVTTYMDGSKRIRAYPIDEDTTGAGTDCYYIGTGRKLFGFAPDSTDVYKFYEITGADTAVAGMDSVLVWSTLGGAYEGMTFDQRAFGDTCIATAAIKLLAVTTARIAADAVDSTKVSAIGSGDITDGQVKTADVANLGITSGKLAAGAVSDSTKVAALAITRTRLAAGAVGDSSKIAAGAITRTRLASNIVSDANMIKTSEGRVALSPAKTDTVVTNVIKTPSRARKYVEFMTYTTNPGPVLISAVKFNAAADSVAVDAASTRWAFVSADSTHIKNRHGAAAITTYGDSLRFYGVLSNRESRCLKIKNAGGVGVTTIQAPRVTSAQGCVLPIGASRTTDANGRLGIYTPGMTTAGRAIATQKVSSGTMLIRMFGVECKTDSIVVYSVDENGDPQATAFHLLWWQE